MLYTRYRTAADMSEGKDVLEVACGCGLGLGYVARRARRVVGGDYTEALLRIARSHCPEGIALARFDALALPFREATFDVVFLYEAIYYLAGPEVFLRECRRVLRKDGVVLVCTVNKEWRDFNPSPLSRNYLGAGELAKLMSGEGFSVEVYGAFPIPTGSPRQVVISLVKRAAMALHLMPKTMKRKEWLKRMFFGKLIRIPPQIAEGMVEAKPLVRVDTSSSVCEYKVLYAVGRV